MASVGTPVVRRIAQVSRGAETPAQLLARVGLSPEPDAAWAGESVAVDAYYDLVERAAGPGDHGLPFRYAEALRVDDLGALGLALKTAPTARDALGRLVRYVLVLSDTLEYELLDWPWGAVLALTGRPARRRGAALANECALAAVTSALRQILGVRLVPREVTFRHDPPADDGPHRAFFGCAVTFGAPLDGVHLRAEQLTRRTLLGDEGLSAYLLAQLDDLRARAPERSTVAAVRGAVADGLPDGRPSRARVAGRLGMSERTLQRRLAEDGASFQGVVADVRREAAEALLRSGGHSLAEVAFLAGFSDQSAFTRAFKRWTGTTPASFRPPGGDAGSR